jgi:hypothetical protein
VAQGFISNSHGRKADSFYTLFKQSTTEEVLCPQLTTVFVMHKHLASSQNKTKLVTIVLVIFVEELKGNNMQVTKKTSHG